MSVLGEVRVLHWTRAGRIDVRKGRYEVATGSLHEVCQACAQSCHFPFRLFHAMFRTSTSIFVSHHVSIVTAHRQRALAVASIGESRNSRRGGGTMFSQKAYEVAFPKYARHVAMFLHKAM